MLYKNRKEKTEIGIEKAKEILQKNNFSPKNIYPGSLSYTNDVYIFEEGNKSYVLKFFTDQWVDKDAGFREYHMLLRLREEGIPVPNVVLFKKSDPISPRNFMIMEKIEGDPLYKSFETISLKTIKEAINILKKFINIKGEFGFYEHDEEVHKTYSNYFDFLNDNIFLGINKCEDMGFKVYNLINLLEKWREYDSEEDNFCLTHSDFTPKHIFVNGDKIAGLIDFEWAIFSEPINDAALFLISLSEYNVPKEFLEEIYNYCLSLTNRKRISYYCSRIYIMKAAWPHKNIEQPYYSQTCLDKAKIILEKEDVELKDVIWSRSLGQIGE